MVLSALRLLQIYSITSSEDTWVTLRTERTENLNCGVTDHMFIVSANTQGCNGYWFSRTGCVWMAPVPSNTDYCYIQCPCNGTCKVMSEITFEMSSQPWQLCPLEVT